MHFKIFKISQFQNYLIVPHTNPIYFKINIFLLKQFFKSNKINIIKSSKP